MEGNCSRWDGIFGGGLEGEEGVLGFRSGVLGSRNMGGIGVYVGRFWGFIKIGGKRSDLLIILLGYVNEMLVLSNFFILKSMI